MSARRRRPKHAAGLRSAKPGAKLGVRRASSTTGWVLVHPACVLERADDLAEVRSMVDAGELDAAIDELRWLLEGCSDMLEAHYLLGKLAVEADGDIPLARGHFGVGYELGVKALRMGGAPTPLPALHPANRPFFDAGRGLAWCLSELGQRELAEEVVTHLLGCDPSDPLGLGGWLDDLRTQGTTFVSLDGS